MGVCGQAPHEKNLCFWGETMGVFGCFLRGETMGDFWFLAGRPHTKGKLCFWGRFFDEQAARRGNCASEGKLWAFRFFRCSLRGKTVGVFFGLSAGKPREGEGVLLEGRRNSALPRELHF